jgi:hypothetical protein
MGVLSAFQPGPNRMAQAIWDVRVRAGEAAADLDQQGDALRVTIAALRVAKPDTVVLFARGTGTLLAEARYTLRLAGRASTARMIGVAIRERNFARARASIPLKPQWQTSALTLRISVGKPMVAWSLCFELGRDAGEIELDEIDLRQAG